jgi:hypothetical protein
MSNINFTLNFLRESFLPIEKANGVAALHAMLKAENEKSRQRTLVDIISVGESAVSELFKNQQT